LLSAINNMNKQAYQREWVRKRREYFLSELGGKCKDCGSIERLEFDHIDPTTKTYDINKIQTRKVEFVKLELDKCQILCVSCHDKKTAKDVFPDHGLQRYERHGCRCDTCKKAKSVKNAKRVRTPV